MVFCFLLSGLLISQLPKNLNLILTTHQEHGGVSFPNPAELSHEINTKDLQTHVTILSSDALGGRLTGSVGEKLAAQYVANIFHYLGLEPSGDNGTYFQEFNFSPNISSRKNNSLQIQNKQHGINVLAKLRLGPRASGMIVVGAHADHLGYGELSGSLAREDEKGMIHYGADDNASGVAGVLEAAVTLSDLQAHGVLHGNKDILFAVWSGEEFGILGSSHFIKNFIKNFTKKTTNESSHLAIVADINLDMIGRLNDNLILQGIGSSSMWSTLIKRANIKHPIPFITQNDPYLPTDSTSFYLQRVPTINFFTGAHEEYHTPRDKPDTLNYEGMKNISEFLVSLIVEIENEPKVLDYQEVQKTGGKSGGGFKVYLGTIPDYASSDISGVKLSGVTKGSPAEHAGLRHDDVIIELAGKKIRNIYDYSFALKALRAGKAARLIVLRGQERVALKIIATSRK